MKPFLTVVTGLLLCLLLWGCTQKTDATLTETVPDTLAAPERTVIHDPDHPMEAAYPGLVRAYPLTLREAHGLRALGRDVLLLSGNSTTTLTLLTGDDLRQVGSLTVDFHLSQEDPSLQIHEQGFSFFDPLEKATIQLDRDLQEVRRISAPQGLSGVPILSADTNTLYYCTAWSVVAWNLENGIRRTVKEIFYSDQKLTALHCNESFLECIVTDGETTKTLLISSDNGVEATALPQGAQLKTVGADYFAAVPDGFHTLMLFAKDSSPTQLLLPRQHPRQQYYLQEDHAVVTVCPADAGIGLDYYELSSGNLRASITLDTLQLPKNIINTAGHSTYILAYDPAADCDILYRWDVLRHAPDPLRTECYTFPYSVSETTEEDALAECLAYANSIGAQYGISIRIGEDACAVQPWDYQFLPEYLAPVLLQELDLLQQRLALYPQGVLEKTAAHFTGLTICLVREISGTADTGSLHSATGIQFFRDNHAYVVIATGQHSEQALYHELYHVMDTHILTESTALDQWEAMNPAEFSYSNGYRQTEAYDIYLQGQTRAFVDSYSMTYPKEDRARILEYAMLQGMGETFRSEYMQRKLSALCTGIREAYRLSKVPEPLPWEQYLARPLVPNT